MKPPPPTQPGGARAFRTTRWSVVLRAGGSHSPEAAASLEQLCRAYWYPLYAYARSKLRDPEAARDATQDFFVELVARKSFRAARPEKGRFRTFLLTAFQRHLIDDWRRDRAQKRGGQAEVFSLDAASAEERFALEPADPSTPEILYERSLARALLDRALDRLADEYRGHALGADGLRALVTEARGDTPQAGTAARAGLSLDAFKSFARRARRRWGELVREEVAELVDDPAEIENELRHLIAALG